ncbi:hypothetical protein [Alkaliphilus serpentinus]|uniref:Uncharacterized protein n=1 Tax=Alkaliphilus serpentinus TaxID=1482731 RepID=A0A833M9H9_9FIRM|nr:hypothetical protein [Alkaliphilus serpentinus]KAB3533555.1 hypothetical protein F8153_00445 [Alkaliphilus serpentinus]
MFKQQRRRIYTSVIVIGLIIFIAQFVYGNQVDPGSTEDPIVTQSYVEQRIQQLRFYVDEKLKEIPNTSVVDDNETNSSSTYVVVELKAGESVIAGAGTEIIVRSGKVLAKDSPSGGLSDVTGAVDIKKDQVVPANHLIIIPRDDGRGVKAEKNSFLLIRGAYQITK